MNDQNHELRELIFHHTENQNGSVHVPSASLDHLLDAVKLNNEPGLHTALSQAVEEDFTRQRFHRTMGNRNILTIACADSNVQENVFKILFGYTRKHFNHLDFTERGWYYWMPIHFAAYHTNVGKLRVIIEAFGEETSKLNALSIVSENALHVLLEYGRRVESFNVQLSNSWESRMCHVIAEEKTEVVECAKLLINAGIDVNHNNIWNETPLIIAIRYRLGAVIELLLKRHDIDLDRCKDSFSGKSARELLRENEICLDLLTPNTTAISHGKALFTFLKNRDEELFLRYNNENIREYVREMDGNHEANTSATMLQLCLIKGYIDYEKERANSPEPTDSNIFKTPMLKFFCQKGFGRSIEHLLNNGAVITSWIFQMAVKLNYYPFLAILLEHRSNQITQKHILEILGQIRPANSNARHVLCLLISKLEMFRQPNVENFVSFEDRIVLNRILDIYLTDNSSDDKYKDNICQLLRLGATLNEKIYDENTNQLIPRLNKVSYKTLRAHLDECIRPTFDGCYDSLVRDDPDEYSETEALHYLSHDPEKNDLLNHPALVYLIYQEWLKHYKAFYVNLAFYALFMLILYWYMVRLQMNMVVTPLLGVFVSLLIILTMKEVVQLLLYWPRYFFDISNYLEVTVIVCGFINVFSKDEATMIVSILLSTFIFLSMLGQLPQFTKYMIVFSSTKYFMEYASFYFIQFVSFALCFFILLPPEQKEENSAFGDIMIKLFDALFFFIGQYDGDITTQPNFPIFGRIIVAVFLFCMTIILNNLLVGLIVTDMDLIQKNGKQQRQMKMVRYISRIETFLKRTERFCCFRALRCLFSDTKLFSRGTPKIIRSMKNRKAFDNDDMAYLKEIEEKRVQPKNVLNSLYECIINEIYRDHKSGRGLFEVARLDDEARGRHL